MHQCPYTFVGDGGFGLKSYFMTPFSRLRNLNFPQRIFNYRLSRARRIIECAFGLLVGKWRIFKTALGFGLETVEKIVMCTVALHNFLIDSEIDIPQDQRRYVNDNYDDIVNHDERRNDALINEEAGVEIRELLMQYFNSPLGYFQDQELRI